MGLSNSQRIKVHSSQAMAAMGELARNWEADTFIRNRGRETKALTAWPNVRTTGIASIKACSMNANALEVVASWWIQTADKPCTVPIGHMRREVGEFV